MKKDVSKEEVMQAMRECEEQLGHPPSLSELQISKGVHERHVRKHFLTYKRALLECGMMREGRGYRTSPESLFKDWAELARSLGKIPNITEYDMLSKYSHKPLVTRYGSWRHVPLGLLTLAEESGWEGEWKDVLAMARTHLRETGMSVKKLTEPYREGESKGILKDRETYGPPVVRIPLAHGPMNENGVMFLFAMLALDLGFIVTKIQMEYPDCEAMREMQPDVWQRVRIELEYESRNFVKHAHDPRDCDLIVCWAHNWPDCPLPVIELRKELEKMIVRGKWQRQRNISGVDEE